MCVPCVPSWEKRRAASHSNDTTRFCSGHLLFATEGRSVLAMEPGLLTCGSAYFPTPSRLFGQWQLRGISSPLTAAGPCRIFTGFPRVLSRRGSTRRSMLPCGVMDPALHVGEGSKPCEGGKARGFRVASHTARWVVIIVPSAQGSNGSLRPVHTGRRLAVERIAFARRVDALLRGGSRSARVDFFSGAGRDGSPAR